MIVPLQMSSISMFSDVSSVPENVCLLILHGEFAMLTISELNHFITSAISSDKGIKNLMVLGPSSLLTGFLFASITIANIREQEREAHYYNATQMAEALKFRLTENEKIVDTSSPKNLLEGSLLDNDTFTAKELAGKDLNLLRVSPDATASRLNGEHTPYDLNKSKVKVIFYKGEEIMPITDESEKETEIFKVNLVASSYTNEEYADISGFVYVAMLEDPDAGITADDIKISVEGILDPTIIISENTFPLPDDEVNSNVVEVAE